MLRGFEKLSFLFFSIKLVVTEHSPAACPPDFWRCNSGQCINSDYHCDGICHCDDRSDETVEECLLLPCPDFGFRCAYGACITGSFKCNGVVDCVDGSDENRYLCNPKLCYRQEMQGKCRYDENMQCKSGECISDDNLCDGRSDCADGSDETVEACSFIECPWFAFRCGYGACITGTLACNGVRDCRDGSDEIASLCPNITGTIIVTPEPQATELATVRPISSTTMATNSLTQCSAMTLRRGISTVAACFYQNTPVSCYEDLRAGTVANVSCAVGYVEKEIRRNFYSTTCDPDGEWTRPKVRCTPECGTLTGEQRIGPWDVTILRRTPSEIYVPKCSGVIVSNKIVLTAAGCFLDYNNTYDTNHIFFNLIEGFYNESYSDRNRLNVQVHNISGITIQNSQRTEGLAVLVLVNYFKFSSTLKPICLPTAQSNVFPLYSNDRLNIGRPIVRDTNRIYLEYLIAGIENKSSGRRTLAYVNIYQYIPFILREIKRYEYLL